MKPCFGDLVLLIICVNEQKPKVDPIKRRDWRLYSKDLLCDKLKNVNWLCDIDDVQGFWNHFEIMLVTVIDNIVPLKDFIGSDLEWLCHSKIG